MTSSGRALALVLLAAGASMGTSAGKDPPTVVRKAEETADSDPDERERREQEAADDAREAATMTPISAGGVAVPTSGTFVLSPLVAGRLPFNCLHWAFCRRDGWTQPVPPPGAMGSPPISIRQLLEREGFPLTPVDCDGPGDHVVKLIWHVPAGAPPLPPGALPPDASWVHAMKRLGGEWSSKNGQAGFWVGIADPGAFLDRHYPVPSGQERVVRCFAKP